MDFLEKNFQWIAVIFISIIALFTSNFVNVNGLQEYLRELLIWTPVILFIWFAKIEIVIQKIQKQISKEIATSRDLHDDVIRDLWSVVGSPVKDHHIERQLRNIIAYGSRNRIHEDQVLLKAFIHYLQMTSDLAQRMEYSVDFGAIEIYPGPFYALSSGEIVATNIGSANKGFYGNLESSSDHLVELNADAIKRNSGGQFSIRRVFIIDKEGADESTIKLMKLYRDAGVKVRVISRIKAESIAATGGSGEIRGLQDFSLFLDVNNRNYSGRFFNFSESHKKVLITSNPRINNPLYEQFNLLWKEAEENFDNFISTN